MKTVITDYAQAVMLADLVELQATWELSPKSNGEQVGQANLRLKQATYEAYRSKAGGYDARYLTTFVPERAIVTHHFLGLWCQSMQALITLANPAKCPVNVVEKAFRWADRVAERAKVPALPHSVPTTTVEAIQALAGISLWCDSASTATAEAA